MKDSLKALELGRNPKDPSVAGGEGRVDRSELHDAEGGAEGVAVDRRGPDKGEGEGVAVPLWRSRTTGVASQQLATIYRRLCTSAVLVVVRTQGFG